MGSLDRMAIVTDDIELLVNYTNNKAQAEGWFGCTAKENAAGSPRSYSSRQIDASARRLGVECRTARCWQS